MMRSRLLVCLLVVTVGSAFVACSGKEDEPAPAPKAEPKRAEPKAPPPPPPAAEPEAEPAEPEPTTPEEIELARKAAMMEGRDVDALKYCEMAGIEAGKSDPQALLGCTLAACRVKDMDKARAWSAALPKALLNEAKKVCRANGAPL